MSYNRKLIQINSYDYLKQLQGIQNVGYGGIMGTIDPHWTIWV